jgi:hypothetical protein
MKKITVFLLGLLLLPPCLFAAEAKIASISGQADIKYLGKDLWYGARAGATVLPGQKIKTRPRSRVKLELADGSRIQIFPNSQVDLKNLSSTAPSFGMVVGKLKAWVSRNVNRSKFEVHTPVAVCSVRGTEFTVDVDPQGQTEIEVDKGLVGVRRVDGTGEEIPVGAGERLSVIAGRELTPEQKAGMHDQSNVRTEVGLEMSKEAVQAFSGPAQPAERTIAVVTTAAERSESFMWPPPFAKAVPFANRAFREFLRAISRKHAGAIASARELRTGL